MITLSSYNKFQRNCHRDAVIIAISNSVTSFFSGFVVFSILGYMAHISGKEVKDVFAPGPGLAFIVYPEVVSRIPGSQVWAALFFLMLITLALGSIFGAFETVITALSDQWPGLRSFKPQLVLVCSAVMLVLGLPFLCPFASCSLWLLLRSRSRAFVARPRCRSGCSRNCGGEQVSCNYVEPFGMQN